MGRKEWGETRLGRQEGETRVGREKCVGRQEGVELDKSGATRVERQEGIDKSGAGSY